MDNTPHPPPHINNVTLSQILFWNADGIRNKKAELATLLERRNIRIAMVNETELKPEHRLNFTGYTVYRTDRANGDGGG